MSIENGLIQKQEIVGDNGLEKENKNEDWTIYEPDDFDLRKKQFDAGLTEKGKGANEKLKELYNDTRFARTMIANRGVGSVNHKNFLEGINKIISAEANPEKIYDIKSDDNLIKVIQGLNLPEEAIADIHEIHTHQRNFDIINKITNLISTHRASLKDNSVYYRILHDMATLDREQSNDKEDALNKNEFIVKEARDLKDNSSRIILTKASVGTIWNNQNINDGVRAELLMLKAKEMKNLGSSEELRIRTGAVNFLADHAEKQYQDKDMQTETLKNAMDLAIPLRAEGKKYGYTAVEINALETLVKLNFMKYKNEKEAKFAGSGMSKEAKIAKDLVGRFGRQAIGLRKATHYKGVSQNSDKIFQILKQIS